MNGVIYCRVSSKEQTEGTSLESQETSCREYAQAKNLTIVQTFIERGESAKFADRTALLELIDFVRTAKGKIQVLLVWKVDRFARNVADHFSVKATLQKYGVRIVSVTEPIDANPEGKLMETILAGFAQFDNDIRAMRTVQGMRKKIHDGIFPWHPPLGYRPAQKGEKKTVPDLPDDPLFRSLQKAWKEFATGAYTKADIRRLMTGWGALTRRGEPLSPQAIDKFFENRFYAGVLIDPWTGEEHPGQHRPMVSEIDFLKVQQIIGKRNRSIPHQRMRPEFPLRGLVRCRECGRYLTGSISRGRSHGYYPYYHCGNRQCPRRGKTFAAEAIQADFRGFLESVSAQPAVATRIREAVLIVADERRDHRKARQASREVGLRELAKQTDEIIRMRTQGLVSDDEFLRHKAALEEKRGGILASSADGEPPRDSLRRDLDEIVAPLTDLSATWQSLPLLPRRRFHQLLLPVGFENGNVRTAERGCIFQLSGALPTPESDAVALIRKSWNSLVREIQAFAELLRGPRSSDRGQDGVVRRNSTDGTPVAEMEPAKVA